MRVETNGNPKSTGGRLHLTASSSNEENKENNAHANGNDWTAVVKREPISKQRTALAWKIKPTASQAALFRNESPWNWSAATKSRFLAASAKSNVKSPNAPTSSNSKKSPVYVPPHKRSTVSQHQSVTVTPEIKHTVKSEQRNSQPKPVHHKECLVERLPTKEQAESMKDACLKKGSLFREKFLTFGLKSDFEIQIVSTEGKRGITFSLILETPESLTYTQSRRMRAIFTSHDKAGFLEWLAGAKGWRFEQQQVVGDDRAPTKWKQLVLNKLNCLQDVFSIFAPEEQKFMFPGGKKMTWRKAAELQVCVSDIRMWLETLEQSPLVKKLLRTSFQGPDTCVHWAHHHPLNQYPLTVVTEESMTELINGIIQIFIENFKCPTTGIPLGTRWRKLPSSEKRKTEWGASNNSDPSWTKDRFVSLLDGKEKLTVA